MTGFTVHAMFKGISDEEIRDNLINDSEPKRLNHEVTDLQTAIAHAITYWSESSMGIYYYYDLWKKAGSGKLKTNLWKSECD